MKKDINKFIYWTPRILSVLFILFLALMSLDVFDGQHGFGDTILALFMHNIPTLVLAAIIWVSWKREIIGGVVFILAGILYMALINWSSFEWYYLVWVLEISGTAFLIGGLFLVNWFNRKNKKKEKKIFKENI